MSHEPSRFAQISDLLKIVHALGYSAMTFESAISVRDGLHRSFQGRRRWLALAAPE